MKNTNEKNKENIFESLNYAKNIYNKNTYPQQNNSNNILNSNQTQSLQTNLTHHTINASNINNINNSNGQISTYPSILHTYTKSNGNNSSTSNTIISNSNSPTDNLKVAIRIRPPLSREIEKNLPFRSIALANKENHSCSLLEYIGAELDEVGRQKEWISNPQMFQIHRFTFDEVFDLNTSQEEVLNVMTEIHSIIFLVPLLNPFALFIEHIIDFTDMLLHRSRHPLLLLCVHFLNLLPVFIFDSD